MGWCLVRFKVGVCFPDGMDVEGGSAEAGQFEDADADVDHW